jgi:hypothetical protein
MKVLGDLVVGDVNEVAQDERGALTLWQPVERVAELNQLRREMLLANRVDGGGAHPPRPRWSRP